MRPRRPGGCKARPGPLRQSQGKHCGGHGRRQVGGAEANTLAREGPAAIHANLDCPICRSRDPQAERESRRSLRPAGGRDDRQTAVDRRQYRYGSHLRRCPSSWSSPWVEPGRKGFINVQALPDRVVEGKVTRTSWGLGANRTLRTELDIPNPTGARCTAGYVRHLGHFIVSAGNFGRLRGALVRRSCAMGTNSACWVLRAGKAVRLPIVVGPTVRK